MSQKTSSRKKGVILVVILLIMAAACALILPRVLNRKQKEEVLDTTELASAGVGDVITMGVYEKDADPDNGAEPLEWLVLAKEEGKLLVTTYYGIDCMTYHDHYGDMTWAECSLRRWMNETFYQTAFTDAERERIALTHVTNSDNPRWHTLGGEDTEDHIFLLSAEEAVHWFGEAAMDEETAARGIKPTAYALSRGAWLSGYKGFEENCVSWWLRSPGPSQDTVACVFGNGIILEGDQACFTTQGHYCVRPAMWIEVGK